MSSINRQLTVLMAVSLLAAVGCANNNETVETDAKGDRISSLEADLSAADAQRIADQEQIRQLMARNDQLQTELNAKTQEAPAPGWQTVPGGVMISVEGTVLFDSGKASLRKGAQATLDKIASALKAQYGNHDIYVFGHTDSQPIQRSGWKDNNELSCQRALSVLRYLKSKGVSSNIAAGGWGDQLPIEPSKTSQKNRRVEVYAMRPFKEVVGRQ